MKARKEKTKTIVDKGGKYITSSQLQIILRKKVGDKYRKGVVISIPDKDFFLPSKQYVRDVLKADNIDNMKYRPEAFDCDDFAYLLKATFIRLTYKNALRRAPFALAVVYGNLPGPHAINLVVDDQEDVYFIEPQADIFIPVDHKNMKKIWTLIF